METETRTKRSYITRTKRTYFPFQKHIRMAPLQEALIEYMVAKYPERYKTNSEFVRIAIAKEAKANLSIEEYEWVCGKVFNDTGVETR